MIKQTQGPCKSPLDSLPKEHRHELEMGGKGWIERELLRTPNVQYNKVTEAWTYRGAFIGSSPDIAIFALYVARGIIPRTS